MQGEDPAVAALEVFACADVGLHESLGIGFLVQEVGSLFAVEDVVAAVYRFRPDLESAQLIDRATFLPDETLRILEPRAVEQVGRDGFAGADEGFAVDVGVGVERPVC